MKSGAAVCAPLGALGLITNILSGMSAWIPVYDIVLGLLFPASENHGIEKYTKVTKDVDYLQCLVVCGRTSKRKRHIITCVYVQNSSLTAPTVKFEF